MHYGSIPGIDKSVSRLALGGWLTFGDAVDDGEALRILHAAFDAGVTMLDLADVYAGGAAEALVGRFLCEVDRERLVVTSKVFWPTSDDPRDRGLSRRHIHASIDRTLQRLGIEHLDLYFCHREDPSVPLAETVHAMGELVQAGKVTAWGTSCWQPRTLREAHRIAAADGHAAPVVEQPPYNLLERWVEHEVVPCCRELGMALVAFSPLAQGALTGKYLGGRPSGSRASTSTWVDQYLEPAPMAAVRAFVQLCQERGSDPAVVALAWVAQQPGFAAAILGVSNEQQLRHNLAAGELQIDGELAVELDRIFRPTRRSKWKRWLKRLLRRS